MATTKFYLDLRGKAKDGKGNLLIILVKDKTSASFPTGIRIKPDEWNGAKVVKHPGSYALNAELQQRKSKIDESIAYISLLDEFAFLSAADIKKIILDDKVKKTSGGHSVSDLFEEYLTNGQLKEGTKEIYRSALKKVLAFGGNNLRIEQINLKWLRSFDSFLSSTQGINGKSIYLRSLRAVCNYSKHIGIKMPYPFENFQIKSEPTQKRSVPIEKMREFISYPVDEVTKKYRDYFLLMFYLIGINTKDLLLARKEQLVKGRLEYVREKTNKKYSIKIEPEAKELLSLYAGSGDYLLEAMDHCKHYKSFGREINDFIQTIGPEVEVIQPSEDLFAETVYTKEIQPIIPGITTYFARHSWATYAYEIGIPLDVISQALGHSFGNRTTLIYVRYDQSKVDEANRKVIDYLNVTAKQAL